MCKQGCLAAALAMLVLAVGCAGPKQAALPPVDQQQAETQVRLVNATEPAGPEAPIVFDGPSSVDARAKSLIVKTSR